MRLVFAIYRDNQAKTPYIPTHYPRAELTDYSFSMLLLDYNLVHFV